MKKHCIFINLLIIFLLAGCSSDAQSLADVKGQIVMSNPDISNNDNSEGILIYTPSNNNYLYLAKKQYYRELFFSENKDKILAVIEDRTIVEYDVKTKQTSVVYEGDKEEATYDYVKYVPKTNAISFIGDKLYIFDRITKERKPVIKTYGEYSWSKDGTKLYYSGFNENKIYCLDRENNKVTPIGYGGDCQLSNNSEYLAFKTDEPELTVRELKTGKEWRYKAPVGRIEYFRFSPDDKYIAILQEHTLKKYSYGKELMGWDFKTNNKVMLIEHINNDSYSSFDWK